MTTLIIGIILIILLILSLIPNYRAMKINQAEGNNTAKFKFMVGVDAVLIVLLVVTVVLKIIQ